MYMRNKLCYTILVMYPRAHSAREDASLIIITNEVAL